MYLEHFGLEELPFTLTPDTGFFMNRAGHQDALNVLLVALRSGEGFVKVTGEVGVGKTLLCRKLLNSLQDEYVTAYIYNPYLDPDTLLAAIADNLGVDYGSTSDRHGLQKLITEKLLRTHAEGRQVVLCLDEVQAMPVRTLETLRLLTNLETEKCKLLQVVLFGQPELELLLEQPSVRQLKQRITYAYRLQPLTRTALLTYIRHRLVVAGYRGGDLFSRGALDCLYAHSGGIPRLINILSHKSLMVAYGRGDKSVRANHVRVAVADSPEAGAQRRRGILGRAPAALRWLYGTLGLTALISLLVHAYS